MEKHPKLPTKLGKPVLIDALFEIRFEGASAADVLPGLFYAQLGPETKIERLPISNIPPFVRQADPNLAHQPLVRLMWGKYLLLVGDGSLTLGCQLPYPGWAEFRVEILRILKIFAEARISKSISRYAIKYVDLINEGSQENWSENISMALSVGGMKIGKLPFNLNAELDDGNFKHSLQLTSPANVQLMDGQHRVGLIISIDTIMWQEISVENLLELIEQKLDEIHYANKAAFFSCLTEDAIKKLEPDYA